LNVGVARLAVDVDIAIALAIAIAIAIATSRRGASWWCAASVFLD